MQIIRRIFLVVPEDPSGLVGLFRVQNPRHYLKMEVKKNVRSIHSKVLNEDENYIPINYQF